ncbi:MAG: isoprenylcysteine carboxylmethyltransferase family protein [Alphaproteobacteria bacterium]|nr:isoprenylcysteine carboxylmethyltransferase family protein [Alphaproteobacteria bacterium]
MQKLERDAIRGLFMRSLMLAVMIFVPAGRIDYWQAWIFLVVFISCSVLLTAYLWKNNKTLLEQRVYGGYRHETRKIQKVIMLSLSIISIGQVICSVLDYRFNSHHPSPIIVLLGDVLIIAGFYITLLVFRENNHASATVEAHPGQTIVATGPYAVVRHPMYAGGFLTFCGIPLALASYAGLAFMILMVPLFIARLYNEEAILLAEVPAYRSYTLLTPWRLLPKIF